MKSMGLNKKEGNNENVCVCMLSVLVCYQCEGFALLYFPATSCPLESLSCAWLAVCMCVFTVCVKTRV